ncbi:hypothetical protein H0H81_012790 [Sphagnurus paluster]|uniref:Uncharacterized protein n=1 Tax=Sphagnurus paluster TaxID=117069 RepID=A0A9P7K352_9AGAR|nr:hypothetical protein H0H81_012790 [Sphagnurus paluster]
MSEDAAATFAIAIDAITPLLSKMAQYNVQLDHSNPDIQKFLFLAGVTNNPNEFKDPNDTTILSLLDESCLLKSTITEKNQLIKSLQSQIQSLQKESKCLGKQPAAQGMLSSPTPSNDILQQILTSITYMQKEIKEIKGQKADNSLGASIHTPNPMPVIKPTPQLRPTPTGVWVPNHTLCLKGEFNRSNFPGGVPHPIVTSTQYPKGHPDCYKPIPTSQGQRNGTAVLPQFPPEVNTAQGGKPKGKGKGKGKATLGPSPSQAESSNTIRNIPHPPSTGLYTMPLSWDEEMEHISTQGAAELEASLPPVYYNPPPPAKYIDPPTATSFAAKDKAAANIPQPAAPKQTKGKISARPKTKVINARKDIRYQLVFKDKSRLVVAFNSALKERILAELAKDHLSLKDSLGVVSMANWSASHNVAVWLHEAVTHVTFPGLSNLMVSAAQKLGIMGSSIPEFKCFSPTCQIETSVPIWNFTTNAPYSPAELHQALTEIGVF